MPKSSSKIPMKYIEYYTSQLLMSYLYNRYDNSSQQIILNPI